MTATATARTTAWPNEPRVRAKQKDSTRQWGRQDSSAKQALTERDADRDRAERHDHRGEHSITRGVVVEQRGVVVPIDTLIAIHLDQAAEQTESGPLARRQCPHDEDVDHESDRNEDPQNPIR